MVHLSLTELNDLRDTMNQELIALPQDTKLRYVVLDGAGKTAALVTDRHSMGTLARIMRRVNPRKIAESTKKRAAKLNERHENAEELANRKLRLARLLMTANQTAATRLFNKIIQEYPHTKAAGEARQLLVKRE